MKKSILKTISTFLFLTIVCGCNNNDNSISSSSTSNIIKDKTFSEMLDEIKNPNITYHSDYLIYYYPEEDSSKIYELQRYDVVAKISEELYEMKAYIYGTTNIASYAHYEKDEDGYVTSSDVDILNELVVKRVLDGNNEEFLWEDSVYFNMIKNLSYEDFEEVNTGIYAYKGDLNETPLNIIHTAIPTSYFTLESMKVIVKNNSIESFIFQEVESDQAYEDCMYGRSITLSFENIGKTVIDKLNPYEEKEENSDLGLALEDMRNQNNYTINSVGVLKDGSIENLQETYITENDILQVQHVDTGEFVTGIHNYNDELYTFESVDKYLLGSKTNSKIKDFIPKFYFSEHVFEYLGEENESKVYRPYQNMAAVLNYIDVISMYEEAYYAPAGDIKFYVKDCKLEKIEFPVFLYSTSNYREVTNRITYENIGTTTIDESNWENFVLELPGNEASEWNDYSYNFMFEYSDTIKEEINLGVLFEKCLGSANAIPYFLPSSSNIEVSGNYSSGDNVVYVTLESLKGIDGELLNKAELMLTKEGFKKSTEGDGFIELTRYYTSSIEIEIICIPSDNFMEIVFTLPVGDLLN